MAADKHLYAGQNHVRDALVEWRTSGSWSSGADGTDADYPTVRAGDGHAHNLRTRPSTTNDPWYLIINFQALVAFDCIALINHNLGISGMSVSVQIADDPAYSTNLITLATFSPGVGSALRLVDLALDHSGASAFLYTAQYARILVDPGSAMKPELGEVIFSQRRQLEYNPNDGYDPDLQRTRGNGFRAASGVQTFYRRSVGQKLLEADYTVDGASYVAAIKSLWEDDCEHGSQPFLWVPRPATAPTQAHLMRFAGGDDITFGLPHDGPSARAWVPEAEEVPTYWSDEV